MTITPEHNINTVGKFKNIALGFVVILVWIIGIQAFLSLFINIPSFIPNKSTVTVIGLFFGCVWAPLWEELAFRVVPITLAKVISAEAVLPVVFLSSLLFGWGHNHGPVSLLFQGVTGFIISVVYIKNNYCYFSVVGLHAFWNLFCFLFF